MRILIIYISIEDVESQNPKINFQLRTRCNANMAALDAYISAIALNETLMTTVEQLYKTRDITNIKAATAALDGLKANDFTKFTKEFASISKFVSNISAKTTVKRETKYQQEKANMYQEVRGVEQEGFNPNSKPRTEEPKHPPTKLNS